MNECENSQNFVQLDEILGSEIVGHEELEKIVVMHQISQKTSEHLGG